MILRLQRCGELHAVGAVDTGALLRGIRGAGLPARVTSKVGVLTDRWERRQARAFLVCAPLFTIELGFLGANIVKIPHGGWFAITIGVILMVQMQTWRTGRALVAKRIRRGERPLQKVLDESNPERVPGTAVFMFKDLGKAPPALVNNLRHNKVLHKSTLIVSVETADTPRVPTNERATVTGVEPGVFQVQLVRPYGRTRRAGGTRRDRAPRPRVRPRRRHLLHRTRILIAGKAPGMNPLAEHLFA